MPWREKKYHCGGQSWRGGLFTQQLKKWVKSVFLLGCYGCIFHETGNSAQLCQNLGILGGVWTPQTPCLGTPLRGSKMKLTIHLHLLSTLRKSVPNAFPTPLHFHGMPRNNFTLHWNPAVHTSPITNWEYEHTYTVCLSDILHFLSLTVPVITNYTVRCYIITFIFIMLYYLSEAARIA